VALSQARAPPLHLDDLLLLCGFVAVLRKAKISVEDISIFLIYRIMLMSSTLTFTF
jgi:hypothetical protein